MVIVQSSAWQGIGSPPVLLLDAELLLDSLLDEVVDASVVESLLELELVASLDSDESVESVEWVVPVVSDVGPCEPDDPVTSSVVPSVVTGTVVKVVPSVLDPVSALLVPAVVLGFAVRDPADVVGPIDSALDDASPAVPLDSSRPSMGMRGPQPAEIERICTAHPRAPQTVL